MARYVDIEPYEDCRIILNKEDVGFPCRDLPTADVEEVRHGEWIVEKINGKKVCYCSKCGVGVKDEKTDRYMDMSAAPFCPNCGAKMDGGKE